MIFDVPSASEVSEVSETSPAPTESIAADPDGPGRSWAFEPIC